MAFFNDTQTARPSFFDGFKAFFRTLGSSIDLAASANARLAKVEELSALSDAQLAKKGLRREDIARYVFRDIMHL